MLPPATVPLVPLVMARLWPSSADVGAPVWVHGVSLGEVEVASALAKELRVLRPGLEILLTSTTPAGVALLSRRFDPRDGVTLRPFPLDLPFAVRRFFAAARARVLVLVETELWPAVLSEAGRRGVRVLLVNARLGERSARRYAALGRVLAKPFGAITHVSARTAEDAARFRAIGVDAARVTVEGDMKLDRALADEPSFAADARALRASRPAWIAGSVADDEVDAVLDAHAELRRSLDAFLILAPRRPESFEAVARRVAEKGLALARRSRLGPQGAPAADGDSRGVPPGAANVLLLDSLGELAGAYRLADVAFLGGTFAPRGGHNVLEPLRAGLPTLHGPSVHNIEATLEAAGDAARLVPGPSGLADAVEALLRDPVERESASVAAAALFAGSAGATRRAAERTLALLDEAGA